MKLICQGNELSDALAKVVKALPVKRNNPILDGVKLTALGDTLTILQPISNLPSKRKSTRKCLSKVKSSCPENSLPTTPKRSKKNKSNLTERTVRNSSSNIWTVNFKSNV